MIKYDEDGNEVNTGSYWKFIEVYYPNYDSSDEICDSNDFSRWVEDMRAEPPMGLEDCIKNEVAVFEKALRNYIELRKENDNENL